LTLPKTGGLFVSSPRLILGPPSLPRTAGSFLPGDRLDKLSSSAYMLDIGYSKSTLADDQEDRHDYI
jgi:hypothetical protein